MHALGVITEASICFENWGGVGPGFKSGGNRS